MVSQGWAVAYRKYSLDYEASEHAAKRAGTGIWQGHKIYPYLLRGLRVDRPNQVWCADITYLPKRRGFLHLVAIMDWHTRKVLGWRISNTLVADFCAAALNEAIHKFGFFEIINTDQGSQFMSCVRTDRQRRSAVRISMDGKCRFLDKIFVG